MDIDARFEILDKIGAGSFATVYRARDKELGREVAIKQIHDQYLDDPKLLERYWAESQLLASLQHPNIVTIYDLHRDRGWLIMELMQANLKDRLQGRQMDLKSLKTTIAHCLRALKYLHGRGIIHGDIKPSNLMIDHRRRIKIGDFGLARRVSDEEGSLIKGTTKYMAPEVVSEEFGEVGPASDLYSLGFTAYELMCGSDHFDDLFPGLSAFGRDMQAAWMMWHAAQDRRLPEISRVLEGVPDDLAKVIEKLTEKELDKRYQTADEALSDLKIDLKLVKTGPEEEETPDPEPLGADQKRRRLIIAAFAVSILMSLAMLLMPSGGKPAPRNAQNQVGIVREIDGAARKVVYEEIEEGIPHEITLSSNSRIKLIRPPEPDKYILPREIPVGAWIEIERTRDDETDTELINLTVSLPITSQGELRTIDSANNRLLVSVQDGKVRSDLDMLVPKRAKITINGNPAQWNALREGDRLEVVHLIDPAGLRGIIAEEVRAWRKEQLTAFFHRLEKTGAANELFAHMGKPDGDIRKFTLAPDANIKLSTGDPISPEDLAPGDYLRILADTHIYELTVTRNQTRTEGTILAINEPGQLLIVREDKTGKVINLKVGQDTQIALGGTPATLADLRPEFDDVITHSIPSGSEAAMATSIDAIRGPRRDRWAAIIGTKAYLDRDISPLRYSTDDAQWLRGLFLSRYAFDPRFLLLLIDANMLQVRKELQNELAKVGRNTQVIIYVNGQGYLGKDDRVYLALADTTLQNLPGTGLPLDGLIDLMERCPSRNKILLLDIVHEGTGADMKQQPDMPTLLGKLQTKPKTVTVIGASSTGQRGYAWPEKRHGVFAYFLGEAFRGAADTNKDLMISDDELIRFLEEQMSAAPLPGGKKQTVFVLE